MPTIAPSDTGSMVFTVGGDDPGAFFPVDVNFVAQGSIGGVGVAAVNKVGQDEGEDVIFSVDSLVNVDQYSVV